MKKVYVTVLLGIFAVLGLQGGKAHADHWNGNNFGYNLRLYQCNEDDPADRKEMIDMAGGARAFAEKKIGKSSIVVSGKRLYINESWLYNNCLFVFGKPSDVPGNMAIQNTATGKYIDLFMGYNQYRVPQPNPVAPEDFAASNVLTRSDFNWYKSPWNRPWPSNADFPGDKRPAGAPSGGVNNPERLEALSRAIDKYTGRAPGTFRNGGFIASNGSARELSKYADVGYLGDDWTAGLFTMYFRHDKGHTQTRYRYTTFFIPPKKNPFETNVKAGVKVNDKELYHQHAFSFDASIINDSDFPIVAPCSTTSKSYLKCGSTSSSYQTFTYKIKKGKNQPFAGSSNVVKSGTLPRTTVKANGRQDRKVSNVKLDAGDYTIWVSVPRYKHEHTYNDNRVSININVKSVDLELLNWFQISPNPAKKSDEPIDRMRVRVKNHANIDVKNINLHYKWETESGTVMCEQVANFKAGSTTTVTLGNGSNEKCPSYSANPTTDYPRYESPLVSSRDVNLNVHVNPDKTTAESNYNNNARNFPVRVNGLNARVKEVDINYFNIEGDENSDVKITASFENLMRKPISADCRTNFSTNEICKPSTSQKQLQYRIYDTKWTNTRSDDVLVDSWTDTYSNVGELENTVKSYTRQLPAGGYILRVDMPHYRYEYNYDDNRYEKYFEVDISTENPHMRCDYTDTNYISKTGPVHVEDGIAKFCVANYPRFPSTQTEDGQGAYFYLKYRLIPSPAPPYEVHSYDENGVKQEFVLNEPRNQRGNPDSFLHQSTEERNGFYRYRGRMFADNLKLEYWITDPKGNTVEGSRQTVNYKPHDWCYDDEKLDYTNERICREVTFYIPNDGDTWNLREKNQEPREENKIKFKNVGKHTLHVRATESQFHRVQQNMSTSSFQWAPVMDARNVTATGPSWQFNFHSPTNNFLPPVGHFRTPQDRENFYYFEYDFHVSGVSSGAGTQ